VRNSLSQEREPTCLSNPKWQSLKTHIYNKQYIDWTGCIFIYWELYVCLCIFVCVCVCVCVCMEISVCARVCKCVYCVYVCVNVFVCVYVCVYVCVCVLLDGNWSRWQENIRKRSTSTKADCPLLAEWKAAVSLKEERPCAKAQRVWGFYKVETGSFGWKIHDICRSDPLQSQTCKYQLVGMLTFLPGAYR